MTMTTAAREVSPPAETPDRKAPDLRALFLGFLELGLTGFGGVLPLARAMIVEQRKWLSAEEFTDLLGLCQFLPGGNIINMAVAIGLKFHGVKGAFAALIGLIAFPTAIVVGLGAIYAEVQANPHVQHMFAGLAAAAAGLLVAMAAKITVPLFKRWEGLLVAALCFLAIAVLRLPLLPTMLTLAPASIGLTWFVTRRQAGKA